MSVGLLDVNVLVALFDPEHVHHEAAHAWLAANRRRGWATCPLTENGSVRVLAHPGYRREPPAAAAILGSLTAFRASGDHVFWPDDLTLCDPAVLQSRAALSGRMITDVYLLALAVKRRGRLVSFDRSIPLNAVVGARRDDLVVVGA